MKFVVAALTLAMTSVAFAQANLPTCLIKAGEGNRFPVDVSVEVVKFGGNYHLKFARETVPAFFGMFDDAWTMNDTVARIGRKLPRGTKSMEYYNYSTSRNQAILYVAKSASGKTLGSYLFIDGVGGTCAK
jgi:hypothetical protein